MSSTLCMRVTPKPMKTQWDFGHSFKGIIGRRYYDHDGSLGGGLQVLDASDLPFLEGVLAGGSFDKRDEGQLTAIIESIKDGHTVDMWFEV